jgi:hypothetical protein
LFTPKNPPCRDFCHAPEMCQLIFRETPLIPAPDQEV